MIQCTSPLRVWFSLGMVPMSNVLDTDGTGQGRDLCVAQDHVRRS